MPIIEQLEELDLIRYSLLPDELFSFLLTDESGREWSQLLDNRSDIQEEYLLAKGDSLEPCHFEIRVSSTGLSFQVQLPLTYPNAGIPEISVKGDHLKRLDQERWQLLIKEELGSFQGNDDYPVYQLFSSCLLPLLHSESKNDYNGLDNDIQKFPKNASSVASPESNELWHALLTSHHLKSPTKRRNLHHWADELSLTGFAKLGHPGVIYCSGARSSVEDFVKRVKAMQWLALRVRFVEALAADEQPNYFTDEEQQRDRWVELEKVGEVVEQMRKIGRESYVLEMGIGSAGVSVVK